MSPTWSTFFLEAANFLLLAAALGWLLFKPVRAKLEERATRFRAEADEAARRLENAHKLEAEAKQRHEALAGELDRVRQERLQEADAAAKKIVEQAREAAAKENDAIERRLGRFDNAQVERMAMAVASAASEAVRALLERIAGPDLEGALLRSGCAQLSSLGPQDGGRVVVISARPLPDESRTVIKKALGSSPADIEYEVDEDLGVGLRVRTANGIVDASARGIARLAEQALRERLTFLTHEERVL